MNTAHARAAASLGLGAVAPDAELTNVTGETVFVSSFWQKEPVVLAFLNDIEPDSVLDHALNLRDAVEELDDAGGDIVAVVRNAPADITALRSEHNMTFPMLSDSSGAAHAAYNVPSNAPAAFVIDTGGVIRYAHRATTVFDTPSTWDLVDAVCGLTGAVVERPEPPKFVPAPFSLKNDTAERPFFETGATVKAPDQRSYSCEKCGNTSYEVVKLATSGGWISRIFNFQYRQFVAVVCTSCNYSDLYRVEGGSLANIADVLFGG
jgi:peroxiredoxin/predicted nucleic-acid-binding Zn-ribbon protein